MPENGTPDTVAYLALGLVVVFGLVGGFVASLIARYRSLQKDMQLIEQLQRDGTK